MNARTLPTSSLRTQGPITTGLRAERRYLPWRHKRDHAAAMSAIALTLGVPAFAGTTN
ncbi:hypothetical protein V1290_005753 [Bradyrhizobium sp. AZCC 1578]